MRYLTGVELAETAAVLLAWPTIPAKTTKTEWPINVTSFKGFLRKNNHNWAAMEQL